MITEEGARAFPACVKVPAHPATLQLTYPVLAKVALTPTHTATKTAGRPVCAGNSLRVLHFAPNPMTFLSSLPHPSP